MKPLLTLFLAAGSVASLVMAGTASAPVGIRIPAGLSASFNIGVEDSHR